MKKSLLLFLVITCITNQFIFAFPNEPDGYSGIKWGTPIESLDNMVFKQKDKGNKDILIYIKKDETYLWEGLKLDRVDYVFYRGKFCQVNLYVKGPEKAQALKYQLFKLCGDALSILGMDTNASWEGNTTEIVYIATTKFKDATVWFYSKEFGFSK